MIIDKPQWVSHRGGDVVKGGITREALAPPLTATQVKGLKVGELTKELARLGIVDSPARKSAPKPKKADPKKDAERASKKVDELLRFTQRCARFPRKTAKTLAPSTLSSKQALVRRWRRVMIVSDAGIDAGDEVRAELARKKLECVEATLTRTFENPQYPKADVAFSDDVA